jgi:hypothetical protein
VDAPLASRNTVSFVEVSPSIVIALNVTSTASTSARCSTGGDTTASVVMKPSIVAMLGAIMPAPLAMPPTWNVPAGVDTETAAALGLTSVVMIAHAASWWARRESDRAAKSAPPRILPGSSCTPITPVDAIRTWLAAQPRADATTSAEPRATAIPSGPVHAFAQPLFTRMALACPEVCARCSRETSTGAAWALFVVNTAAAVASPSDTMRARSRASFFLMPHDTPATLKPPGAVMPPPTGSIVTPAGTAGVTTGARGSATG